MVSQAVPWYYPNLEFATRGPMVLCWTYEIRMFLGMTQAAAAGLFNAVKLYHGDLHFTNRSHGFYSKISINATTGQLTCGSSFIANYVTDVDELRFDSPGFNLSRRTQSGFC